MTLFDAVAAVEAARESATDLSKAQVTLSLDLGPSSIGWAMVRDDDATGQAELIDMGVRVFPEGVDNFGTTKQKSKNKDRRTARGLRRRAVRRKRRKLKLREALTRMGLLDTTSAEWGAVLLESPYRLRAEALTRKLTPAELSRVLLHLSQRRGFLSNRKTDRRLAESNDTKGMLDELKALSEQLKAAGLTLGQYLAAREALPGQVPMPDQHRVRNRNDRHSFHATRAMVFDEFEKIWQAQAKHYPHLLTDAARWGTTGPRPALRPHKPRALRKGVDWLTAYGIEGILFFQRPMYWPAAMIGRCELEPRQYRCPRADRQFQRFKILADVNHLRYLHPLTRDPTPLTSDQREAVVAALCRKKKLSFDQIRKAARLDDNCRFTIEVGKKTGLPGHKTDDAMRKAAKPVGLDYDALPEAIKDSMVRLIADPRIDDFDLRQRLCADFSLTAEQAAALAAANLPDQYGKFSLAAIEKLLPQLEAGKKLMARTAADSAMHAAGYLRRDQRNVVLLNELPRLDQIHTGSLADLANPIVKAALHELRKVVNLLIKTYGRPDRVRVEFARDLRMNRKKLAELEQKNAEREAEREAAAGEIKKLGVKPTRDAIERWLLWKEQGEECLYSGAKIGVSQLFGGEVDVDHILPESQCRDNSFMNKVVCFAACNREKGQRTVHQWLAATDRARYEAVLQRARRLPLGKRERLKTENVVLEDFVAQQLVDTSYIARLAAQYLGLVVGPQNVQGSKGRYTSDLRWLWGLDTVLSELPDSPAWQEVRQQAAEKQRLADLARKEGRHAEADGYEQEARALLEHGTAEKNRADHRHHALDALVIALTTPRRIQALTRYYANRADPTVPPSLFADPWPDFRRSVQDKLKTVYVSHRVRRKVSGPLHDDTHYGPVPPATAGDPDLAEAGPAFAVRKELTALTDNEIPLIRDRRIREMVQAALGISGGRAKRGSRKAAGKTAKADVDQRKAVLASLTWPNGLPIRRVRINKPDQTIRPIRENRQVTYVKPGSTHHIAIFEDASGPKPKRIVEFVTMLEAARRVARREPLIRRTHDDHPNAKFVMSLSAGEMVLLKFRGTTVLATYKTAASTIGQIYFAAHADGRTSASYQKLAVTGNTLDGRKVTVDPIGRVRWAND